MIFLLLVFQNRDSAVLIEFLAKLERDVRIVLILCFMRERGGGETFVSIPVFSCCCCCLSCCCCFPVAKAESAAIVAVVVIVASVSVALVVGVGWGGGGLQ